MHRVKVDLSLQLQREERCGCFVAGLVRAQIEEMIPVSALLTFARIAVTSAFACTTLDRFARSAANEEDSNTAGLFSPLPTTTRETVVIVFV